MRFALALVLALAGTAAFAADAGAGDKPAVKAADGKAVNTVCVACGKPVDAKVAPIAGKTKEGKEVMIGCCSDACATEVKKDPAKYADSAVANKSFKPDEKVK